MESKLVALLQFYLSLHEADEIYNMLHDDNVTPEELEDRLKEFRDESEMWKFLTEEK